MRTTFTTLEEYAATEFDTLIAFLLYGENMQSGSEKELFQISLSYQSMEGPIGKAMATDTVAVTPCFEGFSKNSRRAQATPNQCRPPKP